MADGMDAPPNVTRRKPATARKSPTRRSKRIAATAPMAPPSLWKALGEVRLLGHLRHALWHQPPRPCGRGVPVLVVPGVWTNDFATTLLRDHLAEAGFAVHGWELGLNQGPQGNVMRRLADRVRSVAKQSGQRVHLVGWSLGGLMARAVAGRLPDKVGRVVALGSPLNPDPAASHLSWLHDALGGQHVSERTLRRWLGDAAKAPVISICSREDGVVAFEASAEPPGPHEVRDVDATHLGLVVEPAVLDEVVDALMGRQRTS